MLTVISYFCGCGGMDLGFRGGFTYQGEHCPRLPFEIIAAYDNDPRCVETYNSYFGAGKSTLRDLAAMSAQDAPSADILIGGFPCQDFSSCGPLRGLSSDRGKLYKAIVSYMAVHRPKLVICENVANLENIAGGAALKTICADLAATGCAASASYHVDWRKLQAADYGVPQCRTRLFIVCIRDDVYRDRGDFALPEPDFAGARRSVEWAIGDLMGNGGDGVPNQDQFFKAAKAHRGNGQGDETSRRDKPAHTVRANPKSRVHFHYELDRRLTVRECARIQTFPDDFIFGHSATANMSLIGNAVPPILAHKAAKAAAGYLGGYKNG